MSAKKRKKKSTPDQEASPISEEMETVSQAAENAAEETCEQTEKTSENSSPTTEKEMVTISKEEYETLQKERNDFYDQYLRSLAETKNIRQRTARERSQWIQNANERLLLELLEIVDNFERALQTQDAGSESFRKGVEMIYQQMIMFLERENVKPIQSIGKPFDPEFQEALSFIPSKYDENTVCEEIKRGYYLQEKVLRVARVVVSSGPTENTSTE